ncbi:V-type ATP synthase subunit E family protein [Arthrobacter monumenti]
MKKTEHKTRDFQEGFYTGVATARQWAAPRIEGGKKWAMPKLEKGYETASPKIQEGVRRAAGGVAGGVATVTPKIQHGLDRMGPKISHAVDEVTPRIQSQLDRAAPAINHARDRMVDDYIPQVSNRLGVAAGTLATRLDKVETPERFNAVVTRVTGDKKALGNAKKAAVKAARQASKDLQMKRKSNNKGWLVFGIIAAAVVAGVAAWRASKPVEDPWKTPAPTSPAFRDSGTGAPATAEMESQELAAEAKAAAKDVSAEAKAEAKEISAEAKQAAKEVSEEAKAQAKEVEAESRSAAQDSNSSTGSKHTK